MRVSFTLERHMIPIIESNLGCLLSGNMHWVLSEEHTLGTRKVDIAIAALPIEPMQSQAELTYFVNTLAKLTLPQLHVLSWFAQQQELSIHFLDRQLLMEPHDVRREYLDCFLSLKLVERSSRYCYMETGWSAYLPTELLTIEAKLKNWAEVLSQAISTKSFSSAAFVAIDEERWIHHESRLEEAISHDIGVMLVHEHGNCQVISRPQSRCLSRDAILESMRILKGLLSPKSEWRSVH